MAAATLLLLAGGAADLRRAPADQWSTRAALGALRLYQRTASPVMRTAGVECRFVPTCSRYSLTVIEREGILRGGWKTGRRLLRCGPWTPAGTVDPPGD